MLRCVPMEPRFPAVLPLKLRRRSAKLRFPRFAPWEHLRGASSVLHDMAKRCIDRGKEDSHRTGCYREVSGGYFTESRTADVVASVIA